MMGRRQYRKPTRADLVAFDIALTVSVLMFVFVVLSGVFFLGRAVVRAIF